MDIIQISIILSFAAAIIVGLFAGKKIHNNILNFTVAGRSLSGGLIGLALVAQAIDGNATFGNTQLSYDFGFWAGASLPIGLALSLFILGKFFAAPLNNLKLVTMADLFEVKYNRLIGFLASIILLLGFGVLLAGNIAAVGILIKLFFNISYESAVILVSLVVLLYTIRRGIISDIYSDILQVVLIVAGIFYILVFLFVNHGFINIFASDLITSKFSLVQLSSVADGALINWATILALGFGNLIAIDFGQRIFAAKSGAEAKKGCYLGGFFTLILGLLFSFIMFYIYQLNIKPSSDIPIIIVLLKQVLPPFIAAFLITGIINAALSTVDGAILSMGNILTRNLLRVWPEHHSDDTAEKTTLYFLRISLIPIACSAMIFAILLPSPGALLSIAFDIAFAALLVPFVFAFSKSYANAHAALYAIIVGGVSRIIFATLTPTIFGLSNPFYIQNTFVSPSLDGIGTMLAPLLALVAYIVILNKDKRVIPATQ
ncbi:MAG: sodium:solute symporter [Candidatus Levybacteria bacterium]|nr:sodium:solute symporter [Candidatus Levybacteria bacterium]